MPIMVAEHAGFCMGVKNAVELAQKAAMDARAAGLPCYSLGEVVHNPSVTQALHLQGVQEVESVSQAKGGVLILRSHGVSPDVLKECAEYGIRTVDCTCANVRALHEKVDRMSREDLPVIMLGEGTHPEVRGTAGWCHSVFHVVSDISEAEALPDMEDALIVAQTTLPPEVWEVITPVIAKKVSKPVFYRSICAATRMRQQAAKELAAVSDRMIVVGGKQSANTRRLYETCRTLCSRTIWVESADEIPSGFAYVREHSIGITAGASTPDWSLKEVVTAMNDNENKVLGTEPAANEAAKSIDENDFMASIEASMRRIHTGQTVTGTVVQVTDDEVCVNIGYKSDGLVKRSDLVDKDVKIGDEIEVEVVKVNDGEGNVILSQRNIINKKAWDELMAKNEAGEYVEGVGKEAVKGGLICLVNGVRAFVPASRLSKRYVEKIDQFVGQTMKLKIIDVDAAKKRIVCSRKDVIVEEETAKKAAAWEKIEEGAVVTGIVRRFSDFGAFVDLGGVDGLIHITDLAWHRVAHPSDVLQVNQEVEVKILSVDRERERIQLGYKQLQAKPWDNIEEKYPVGLILERKVVRLRPFGAFIELEPGVDGLVHISQVALTRVNKIEDALTVGQDVTVKVLGVDPAAHRISLSIREVLEETAFDYEEVPGDAPAAEEQPAE